MSVRGPGGLTVCTRTERWNVAKRCQETIFLVHILFTYHPIDKWQDGRTYECKSTSQCHVPSQNQFRICHTWNDRTPVTLNMLEVKISKVTACSRSKGPNCSWLSGQKPSTRQKNTACLNAQSMWFAPQSSNHSALLRHFHGALSNYITLNSETPTDTRKRPSIRENTRMNANLALTSASPSTFLYTLDRVIENFGLQAQATAASKFLRQCTPMCFDLAVIQPLGDRTLRTHTHAENTREVVEVVEAGKRPQGSVSFLFAQLQAVYIGEGRPGRVPQPKLRTSELP